MKKKKLEMDDVMKRQVSNQMEAFMDAIPHGTDYSVIANAVISILANMIVKLIDEDERYMACETVCDNIRQAVRDFTIVIKNKNKEVS